jgi:hypothetical protein
VRRAELAAAVAAVLDQPRTDPDRLGTIMALIDRHAAAVAAAAIAATANAAAAR